MVIDLRKVQGRLWPEIGSCQSSVVEVSGRRSVVSDSLWPHGPYRPWTSPGQNTGVGSLSLLQGLFPTQGSNLGLPHCRRILNQLSQGKVRSGCGWSWMWIENNLRHWGGFSIEEHYTLFSLRKKKCRFPPLLYFCLSKVSKERTLKVKRIMTLSNLIQLLEKLF